MIRSFSDRTPEPQEPNGIHCVRHFLGLTSFFREFIKNYKSKWKERYDLQTDVMHTAEVTEANGMDEAARETQASSEAAE